MRKDILTYYIGGRKYQTSHNKYVIDELERLGYLKWIFDWDTDVYKTTEFGKKYLKTL